LTRFGSWLMAGSLSRPSGRRLQNHSDTGVHHTRCLRACLAPRCRIQPYLETSAAPAAPRARRQRPGSALAARPGARRATLTAGPRDHDLATQNARRFAPASTARAPKREPLRAADVTLLLMESKGPGQPVNGDQVRDTRFWQPGDLGEPDGYDAGEVDDLIRCVAAELDAGRPAGPVIESATLRRRGDGEGDMTSMRSTGSWASSSIPRAAPGWAGPATTPGMAAPWPSSSRPGRPGRGGSWWI